MEQDKQITIPQGLLQQMQEEYLQLTKELEKVQQQYFGLQRLLAQKDQTIKSPDQTHENMLDNLYHFEKITDLLRKNLKSQLLDDQEKHRCQNGHLLRYIIRPINCTFQLLEQCRGCKQPFGTVCWSCSRCITLMCTYLSLPQYRKCKGFKLSVCPFSHPLKRFKKQQPSSITCDICKTQNILSGWHCDCDFDICDQCYQQK